MVPPGSRYDKTDPFDNPLRVQPKGINDDFIGFDQFGNPIRKNKGGMGGGFGPTGGFGGNSGGFGGGNSGGLGGFGNFGSGNGNAFI